MAKTQSDGRHNSFSIIVKSKDDEAGKQKETGTDGTAEKYRKSANSCGSKDSQQETHFGGIRTESENVTTLQAEDKEEVAEYPPENPSTPVAESPRASQSLPVKQHSNFLPSEEGPNVHSPYSSRGSNAPDYVRSILLDPKDKKFKHQRHSLWYRLRFRHVHMGVVEVTNDHQYYSRLQAISTSLSTINVNASYRSGPLENMETEHYRQVIDQQFTVEGKDNKELTGVFETFAPAVFATIRRAVSVREDSYMTSIISKDHAYLEFISNSRSGQDFFLSSDMRYLIKTNKEKDVKFLLSILGDYLQHFLNYPHSLVVKYLGCYSVQFTGKKKTYFLVMQNVFYPADRIEDRFDVKGCTAGRYQEPDPPESHTITVLKDQNFFQEELQLGVNREWFIDQITADSTFLKNLNVMDYSLLVGRQKLRSYDHKKSLPKLVSRINRSKILTASSNSSELTQPPTPCPSICNPSFTYLPGAVISEALSPHSLPHSISHSQHRHPSLTTLNEGVVSSHHKGRLQFPRSLVEDEDEIPISPSTYCTILGRRRLLPDCTNALHIVDGPEFRYYFGIVDFLTRWTLKQKLAYLWKEVKYVCGEHSTMRPDYYSQRFISFITHRTTN